MNEPMTDDRLQTIEAEHVNCDLSRMSVGMAIDAHQHRGELLAEVRRLKEQFEMIMRNLRVKSD